jgi:hypothetical protein
MDMRAGMDANGDVTAWEADFYMPQQTAGGFLVPLVAATLAGMPAADHIAPGNVSHNSAIQYKIPNVKTVCKRLESTPFRPSWIRTPGRLQNTYANECFIDELAAASSCSTVWQRSPSGRSGHRHRNRRAEASSRDVAFHMSSMSWCAPISVPSPK